jgi:hypothetical protein
MKGRKHSPEQIIRKLREADRLAGEGPARAPRHTSRARRPADARPRLLGLARGEMALDLGTVPLPPAFR